jgi:electron transfer flavoprotein beta subunit
MIAACLKWVDRRPDLDATSVAAPPDSRFAGVSAADQAALEWALRCRDATGDDVLAITAGPMPADQILRDAIAAGATQAIRIDMPFDCSSRDVAHALASHLGAARLVWCGDFSFDRGTGSVPSFLAAQLDVAQALGLVGVERGNDDALKVTRRLDGGRREILRVTGRAVLSVEGSTALLRRAPLRAMLGGAAIDICHAPGIASPTTTAVPRPYRPRPRALPAPAGHTALERVKALTAADAPVIHGETIALAPAEAAARILSALREWGYLP